MNGRQAKKLRKEASFLNNKPLNYLINPKTKKIILDMCERKMYKICKKLYKGK